MNVFYNILLIFSVLQTAMGFLVGNIAMIVSRNRRTFKFYAATSMCISAAVSAGVCSSMRKPFVLSFVDLLFPLALLLVATVGQWMCYRLFARVKPPERPRM